MNSLVNTKIVATILGVHPETLRDWSRRGLHCLPAPDQMGSRFRWDATELNAWVQGRKRHTAVQAVAS